MPTVIVVSFSVKTMMVLIYLGLAMIVGAWMVGGCHTGKDKHE
jgi:hypothetical protein